ncbi:MAG: dGTP triphosphohydrolase [Pseudomonadota bacterium]
MDWSKLLQARRFDSHASSSKASGRDELSHTLFREDAFRVISSTGFRRLQGKTQVYPFPVVDNLRTRLTHTMEVATVGQELARQIALKLNCRSDETKLAPELNEDFQSIVYVACLCHDLGNPAFGHIGENAIQSWFTDAQFDFVKKSNKDITSFDYLKFDGNAQSFRMITRLLGWREKGGMRLSLPVTASIIKYPYSWSKCYSNLANANKGVFEKGFPYEFEAKKNKFGFFMTIKRLQIF